MYSYLPEEPMEDYEHFGDPVSPEPDIDSQIRKFESQKRQVTYTYTHSEKTAEDASQYERSLCAIESNLRELYEKKYWKEEVKSASLSAENQELKETLKYNFSKSLYLLPVLGFLFICAKYGIPSDFIGIVSSLIFAPLLGFLFLLPTLLFSKEAGIYGKVPEITAIILYVITAIIIIISF